MQNGALALIQFPGTFVMLRQGTPTGGTVGSTVNHFGFLVKDIASWIAKWQAAGLTIEQPQAQADAGYLIAPGRCAGGDPRGQDHRRAAEDAPRALLRRVAARDTGVVREDVRRRARKARSVRRGGPAGRQPDVHESRRADRGTKGRSFDHVGFEVRNLEAFCKKLEADGIKLDRAFTRLPNSTTAIAFLTNPWGTYVELTENLAPAK